MPMEAHDSMLEIFVFETGKFLEQLEEILINTETGKGSFIDFVPEIFRIMHTIKSSAGMMGFSSVASLTHAVEDLFFYIRENKPSDIDYIKVTDIVFDSIDFIRRSVENKNKDGESADIKIAEIKGFLEKIKEAPLEEIFTPSVSDEVSVSENPLFTDANNKPFSDIKKNTSNSQNLIIKFKSDCQMLALRAFEIQMKIRKISKNLTVFPDDSSENEEQIIRKEGLYLEFESEKSIDEIFEIIHKSPFVQEIENLSGNISPLINTQETPPDEEQNEDIPASDEKSDETEALTKPETPIPAIPPTTENAALNKPAEPPVTDTTQPPAEQNAAPSVPDEPPKTEIKPAEEKTKKPEEKPEQQETKSADIKTAISEKPAASAVSASFINVPAQKLYNLVDLVGEIIIAEMELSNSIENKGLDDQKNSLAHLRKLILEMQDAALSTRMIAIRETFAKMGRVVHDMNRKLSKNVRLITLGEDTEVDKNIVDNVMSPLMHMIRNAVDHGIEDAETRTAAGKNAAGTISLSASTEGRDIIITVSDDGKGMDRKQIAEKAINAGIITEADSLKMTDREVFSLIFLPGFSTNRNVTEFSGRGVGMDVVNDAVMKMHGKVSIDSTLGKGTKFTLKIPLTMAIIDAFSLKVGENICAIPVTSVYEIFKIEDEKQLSNINGESVVFLRGECYRVIDLTDFYGINYSRGKTSEGTDNCGQGIINEKKNYLDGLMVVVANDTNRFVVFVDEVINRLSVVVKPVPPVFRGIKGISGCTVLGDGRISLILDLSELYDIGKNGV